MDNYQLNYAAGRPQMYAVAERKRKAKRIIKTLADYFGGQEKLQKFSLLDIGSSTGIIDSVLAKYFKAIVGTDIDEKAVKYAKLNFSRKGVGQLKNLKFKVEDAMNLSFKSNEFDIVVCTQVYEHVPDAKKLFSEIQRILKPGGVCYLAALNRLWPWEPHYDLLFLSWLPKNLANLYLKVTMRGNKYYETPETYWKLRKLTHKFSVVDYTPKILESPKKFGYPEKFRLVKIFAGILKYITPTFFWILVKK